jgi:hypothetical protein
MRIECDRLGAAAEEAIFRMQLVVDDSTVAKLADAAFATVGTFGDAEDLEELRRNEDAFEDAVKKFIGATAESLRRS